MFFVSGAAALLFETLWFRLAGLTFGNSVWASSMVLASFMGGLAVGNGASLRLASRIARPLRAYAMLEIAIGLCGIGLVVFFPSLTRLFAPLFRPFLDQLLVLNPLRLGIAFALMLIPTTAMGASLPLLVRALSRGEESFGVLLGRLYGWNTLGAMAGALAGEAFLIEAFGLRGTGIVAGLLNIAAAVTAFALSSSLDRQEDENEIAASGRTDWAMLAAAALAGGTLLALEVVWFRFLLLFTAGTTMAFAVMLAVVLLGIAAGGLLAAWLFRADAGAERWLASAALACGFAVAFAFASFSPPPNLQRSAASLFVHDLSMSLYLMLPASVLSGLLFTLMGRRIQRRAGSGARATAMLTLANTIGAMIGALAGGFVLLPLLGIERSIFALAACYGVMAVLVLAGSGVTLVRHRVVLAVMALAMVASMIFFPFGVVHNYFVPLVTASVRNDGSHIVAMREGLTETDIYLRKDLWGQPYSYRLMTNGTSMSATTLPARRYMSLFAALPLALHPHAQRALLISYGVGTTAKALTDSDSLQRIDVVDISREVIEMNRLRHFDTGHPLDDPRLHVHIEDGRFFLLTTNDRFDIITAEPPPPKLAGVVNLYTREYFDLIHDRLAEGGMATYWLPIYQLTSEEGKAIVASFCGAFSDCSLWSGAAGELILMGSRGQGAVDLASFTRPWTETRSATALTAIGVESPELLGTLFIADAVSLRALITGAKPLVDDYPLRLSPRPVAEFPAAFLTALDVRANQRRFASCAWVRTVWPPELRQKTIDSFIYESFLNDYFIRSQQPGYFAMTEQAAYALGHSPYRTIPLILMKNEPLLTRIAEEARKRGLSDPLLIWIGGTHALSERRYAEAAGMLEQAHNATPDNRDFARSAALALKLADGH